MSTGFRSAGLVWFEGAPDEDGPVVLGAAFVTSNVTVPDLADRRTYDGTEHRGKPEHLILGLGLLAVPVPCFGKNHFWAHKNLFMVSAASTAAAGERVD